ncbi:hypothetical protein PFL02_06170 [Pseudomonas fluorescens]|nr:hypothetical protein PFL02_06170 [Pseudomonas fluorescens]
MLAGIQVHPPQVAGQCLGPLLWHMGWRMLCRVLWQVLPMQWGRLRQGRHQQWDDKQPAGKGSLPRIHGFAHGWI